MKRTAILFLTFLLCFGSAFTIDAQNCNQSYNNPVLTFRDTASYEANGNEWLRFQLGVSNLSDYSDSLFAASPELPPCGKNTSASRTWVNIYDQDDNRIYGFCALSKVSSLDKIWFARAKGACPPDSVYIIMNDRLCKKTYTSNKVAMPCLKANNCDCSNDDNTCVDLEITRFEITEATPTTIRYTYTITNVGTKAIDLNGGGVNAQRISIQGFVSQDTIFNNGNDVAAGGTVLTISPKILNPGDSIRGGFGAGNAFNYSTHPYLTAKIDWWDIVEECNEENNFAHAKVKKNTSANSPVPIFTNDNLWGISNAVVYKGKIHVAVGYDPKDNFPGFPDSNYQWGKLKLISEDGDVADVQTESKTLTPKESDIIVTPQNNIAMVYAEPTGNMYGYRRIYKEWNGSEFTTDEVLLTDHNWVSWSRLFYDADPSIVSFAPAGYYLKEQRRIEGTWQHRDIVGPNDHNTQLTTATHGDDKYVLAIRGYGSQTKDLRLYHQKGNTTWDREVIYTDIQYSCDVAVDADGLIHVLFVAGDVLLHGIKADGKWNFEEVVSSPEIGTQASIFFDSKRQAYIAYQESNKLTVLSRNTSNQWGEAYVHKDITDAGPTFHPTLLEVDGKVIVVYNDQKNVYMESISSNKVDCPTVAEDILCLPWLQKIELGSQGIYFNSSQNLIILEDYATGGGEYFTFYNCDGTLIRECPANDINNPENNCSDIYISYVTNSTRILDAGKERPNCKSSEYTLTSDKSSVSLDEDITFTYNIPSDAIGAELHYGDGKKITLTETSGTVSYKYSYYGLYQASIVVSGEVKTYVRTQVKSCGWYCNVWSNGGYREDYEAVCDFVTGDGRAYLNPKYVDIGYYWVNVDNTRDFDANGDDAILEVRVKIPRSEGGISCYDPNLHIRGELSDASIHTMTTGCQYWSGISAGKTTHDRSNTSLDKLAPLTANFEDWVTMKFITSNDTIRAYINDELRYTMAYEGEIGQVKGLGFSSKGSGSIDWIKLSHSDGTLVYEENFDDCNLNDDEACQKSSTNAELTFILNKTEESRGKTAKVPVSVKSFDQVLGYSFSISLKDTSIGKITGVSAGEHEPQLINQVSDTEVLVSWNDPNANVNGTDLADSTIVFYVEVALAGELGACTDITFSEAPLELSAVVNTSDGYKTIQPNTINAEVCILNEVIKAGNILTENGIAIQDVRVACNDTIQVVMTDAEGNYRFEPALADIDYTISPTKDGNDRNGIRLLDVILIQQHYLENKLLDSPYKLISADVNNDCKINVIDESMTRRVFGFVDTVFSEVNAWKFVPKAMTLDSTATDCHVPHYEESVTLKALNKDSLSIDFVAVKSGDVTQDATGTRSTRHTNFVYKAVTYQGKEMIAVYPDDFAERSYGFQLSLATAGNPVKVHAPHLSGDMLTVDRKDNLLLGWYHPQGTTIDMSKYSVERPLFYIEMDEEKPISLSHNNSEQELYDSNFEAVHVGLRSADTKTKGLEVYQNVPNPFVEHTEIALSISSADDVRLEIYDILGRVVLSRSSAFSAGYHTISIDKAALPSSGSFYYRISTGETSVTKSMTLIR